MHDHPTLNETEDGYLENGRPVFGRTYVRAMSFHLPEGLAAVSDESGAFHIDMHGTPRYRVRYLEASGFYEGVASVRDGLGWFHIRPDGSPLHQRRFRWSGNFQDQRCAVQDVRGFFHIDGSGVDAYSERFRYAGDFRGGLAVAHETRGAIHIKRDGTPLNSAVYRQAEPFHKGYAVVADDRGFYHVDRTGRPAHALRFQRAEPFYNGVALCHGRSGEMVRLRENGTWTRVAADLKPIALGEIVELVGRGRRVGLFLRHAERHEITPATPTWGNDVLLNQRGIDAAFSLGALLKTDVQMGFRSSPITRCVQTCDAIARGAAQTESSVLTDRHLGDPGIHIDGSGAHREPMRADFHAFAGEYLQRGVAPGMRPLSAVSEELIAFIGKQMESSAYTVFITHDFFSAALMDYLGLKAPEKDDWCAYLEGVCVIAGDDGLAFRRFLGEEAVSAC